jgi:hypothetical protein
MLIGIALTRMPLAIGESRLQQKGSTAQRNESLRHVSQIETGRRSNLLIVLAPLIS